MKKNIIPAFTDRVGSLIEKVTSTFAGIENNLYDFFNMNGQQSESSENDLNLEEMRKKALTSNVITNLEKEAGITSSNFKAKVSKKKTEVSYTTAGEKAKIFINQDLDVNHAVADYAHGLNNLIAAMIHKQNIEDVLNRNTECPEYARRTLKIETEGVIYQALVIMELQLNDVLQSFDSYFDTVIGYCEQYLNNEITRGELSGKVFALKESFKIGSKKAEKYYEDQCVKFKK